MRILVKYPTRSRPELFLKTLEGYISNANNNDDIDYRISFDDDDKTMTKEVIDKAYNMNRESVLFFEGKGVSKIEACNRDINPVHGWDVVLLISDDMEVQVKGWDDVIREDMKKYFPDGDGLLWYHDGSTQKVISTLSCMGKKYYDRYGYIYHPSYKSFFSDNEYTEVGQKQGKIKFIDNVIIKHQHPNWGGGVQTDDLYRENDKHWKHDQDNYNKRKSEGFPI